MRSGFRFQVSGFRSVSGFGTGFRSVFGSGLGVWLFAFALVLSLPLPSLADYNSQVTCSNNACLILPDEAATNEEFADEWPEGVSMLLKADLLPIEEELHAYDHSFVVQTDLDRLSEMEARLSLERTMQASQEFFKYQLHYIPSTGLVSVSSKGK